METEIIKESGKDSHGEKTEYSLYYTVGQYRKCYSSHATIEEAQAVEKWLIEGKNTPNPIKTFFDKKYNGLSEVSAKILLSQLKKREDLSSYNLEVKPYENTGKYYIKATLSV